MTQPVTPKTPIQQLKDKCFEIVNAAVKTAKRTIDISAMQEMVSLAMKDGVIDADEKTEIERTKTIASWSKEAETAFATALKPTSVPVKNTGIGGVTPTSTTTVTPAAKPVVVLVYGGLKSGAPSARKHIADFKAPDGSHFQVQWFNTSTPDNLQKLNDKAGAQYTAAQLEAAPVIIIGTTVLNGFDGAALDAALTKNKDALAKAQ